MAKGIYERKGKNGDVTFYIRYQFKTVTAEGVEFIKDLKEKVGRKSRGFTRELAREALRAREGEIAQGRFNLEKVRKPHPVSELIERYHKHAESYKASYSRERYALEGFKKYFSGRYLSDLTPWVIEKWKREREKRVEKSTVNRELTVLKHMLKMAVKWDLTQSNPAASVAPFPVQEGRIRYLSETEIPALLDACEKEVTSPWLYPLVSLALNTGARQGELIQLQWQDLDLEQGLIYFGRTKNRKLKTVPMNRPARNAIEWLSNHRYGDYLFMWPWGEEIGRTTIYEAFKKACRAAEVQGFRFHDLRHTAASYLVMSGADLTTVKEILGHREIEMTLRYSHLAPAHKASAMDKLGEAFEAAASKDRKEREGGVNEAQESPVLAANLAQIRNVFLVRSGRGLSVIEPKTSERQGVSRESDWWRRGELNPRPKVFRQK